MITNWLMLLAAGIGLWLPQFLAAIPWLAAVTRDTLTTRPRGAWTTILFQALGGLVLAGAITGVGLNFMQDRDVLSTAGRVYGLILHLQLLLDLFVLVFGVLLLVWPRGGAVAMAAFREGIRQPLFWFMVVIALVMMVLMPFLPYFTLGEDLKMVKELGYDLIMLCAAMFAVLAASMSISEEIEGRTAITLMSKPVSRRQFLLGKFFGILMAGLLMAGLLSLPFLLVLWFKPVYDREPVPPPGWLNLVVRTAEGQSSLLVRMTNDATGYAVAGAAWWFGDALAASPGLILGFCQVMVLLAIAVALATRVPMVVNLVVCLVIFFLGHLTPVLDRVSQGKFALIQFMAQLFNHLLPSLESFNIGPALTRDTLPAVGPFSLYVASVVGYALVYTAIALLFGLILFEDRDLA
jgi:hypothetical protein